MANAPMTSTSNRRTALSATFVLGALVSGTLVLGLGGHALARGGGGGGGDGLSPYAALSGNDRSAGVNNGNYRDPALDPYLGAYEGRYDRAVRERYRPSRQPYYGTPY
jgi:hypothetical protein